MQQTEAPKVGQALLRQERFGAVEVLVLANPPLNTLSPGLVAALMAALGRIAGDASARAVILRGEGRGFSSGADLQETGLLSARAALAELCLAIEGFDRPVIAALHGAVLGAGCELALACHYRVAHQSAGLGLPEVGLGLVPGAGSTQRLPRLIGAEQALRLLLTGLAVPAPEALALGLVDRVVPGALGEAALALAQEMPPPRPTCQLRQGLRDMGAWQAALAHARAVDHGSPLPAGARIIACVEAAALLPFDRGLLLEAAAFEDLAATPQARGLRHAILAERQALKPPVEVAGQSLPPIGHLGLWGAEEATVALALQALAAGLRVRLCDPDRARLTEGLRRIAAAQEQAVAQGSRSEEARDEDWARLSSGFGAGDLAGSDLILLARPPTDLPADLLANLPSDIPQALIGALPAPPGSLQAALTLPEGASGLCELSLVPGAPPGLILPLLALGRRLAWRLVSAGPGGPIELGLRLALEAAETALAQDDPTASVPQTLSSALLAYGFGPAGFGAASRPPQMPPGGLALAQACLAALAAEGARMLADGRARSAADIDTVALLSGLMPRWQGGPMFQADQRGLLVLRAELRKRAAPVFAPPPLLDDLISAGRSFADVGRP